MLYRTRIAALLAILCIELVWVAVAHAATSSVQTRSHCVQGTVTNDVVSYGIATRTQACVLALRITAGNVAVRSQGDGIFRSSFN